jgi:PIN domain nuclease of toxin-antitoxin system
MKYLLDTHIILWALAEPHRLPMKAKKIIEHQETELFFSAASLWEIAIKSGLDRADFSIDATLIRRALLDNGYIELPITSEHTVFILNLPPIHKDPFDRILISQAITEGIMLLTVDPVMRQYQGPIQFCK